MNKKGKSGIHTGHHNRNPRKAGNVTLSAMLFCISTAVDLVTPLVNNHHKRVAWIAALLGRELQLRESDVLELAIASAVHDIGAFSLGSRLETLEFETANAGEHARAGFLLIKEFPPLAALAPVVLRHHSPWDDVTGAEQRDMGLWLKAQILHLADRLDVLARRADGRNKRKKICQRIAAGAGTMFMPEVADAARSLAATDNFWEDMNTADFDSFLAGLFEGNELTLDKFGITAVTELFCRIIDFRSPFTATHTSGVAAVAERIAEHAGLDANDRFEMRIAGRLHDLGKLAVPVELLEKPGPLTKREYDVVKRHTLYTHQILSRVPAFDTINRYAALHHERMDGSGYPFRINGRKLLPGSRAMAVADVFTAVAEDRPYRPGMNKSGVSQVLGGLANKGELDPGFVSLLFAHYDDIEECRIIAQNAARVQYGRFRHMLSRAR